MRRADWQWHEVKERASKQMNLQEWHQWNRDTQNRVREVREEKKRWQTSVYREISITF